MLFFWTFHMCLKKAYICHNRLYNYCLLLLILLSLLLFHPAFYTIQGSILNIPVSYFMHFIPLFLNLLNTQNLLIQQNEGMALWKHSSLSLSQCSCRNYLLTWSSLPFFDLTMMLEVQGNWVRRMANKSIQAKRKREGGGTQQI